MKSIFAVLTLFSIPSFATDVMKDFDSIGGNSALMEKVKKVEPDKNINIVQNRAVNRFKRIELAPEFVTVLGGDSYINTAGYGIVGQFHFNPYFSLGARYNKLSNVLSPEGKNLINESNDGSVNVLPDIDQPLNQTLAIANFYPMYGKLNFFNKAVTQFDIYGSVGFGTINLKSGAKQTWTGGAGVGFWFTQHLSTRFELLYQSYQAERRTGAAAMNVTLANLQIGYLL